MNHSNYELKNVSDNYILVPKGETVFDLNNVMKLNKVGALIFDSYVTGLNKAETLTVILSKFDVTEDEAAADYDAFLEELKKGGYVG